ncbi:MAG: hypothetical protein KDA05_05885 [Phycisphaerales bacterium]|nr:hypothetical protein [Phycisphaerales bacterium]
MVSLSARAKRVRERAEPDPSPTSRLTREQVIDRILQFNPSAKIEFLDTFSESSLSHYLDHLVATAAPRGRDAVWVRRGESPAIVGRWART